MDSKTAYMNYVYTDNCIQHFVSAVTPAENSVSALGMHRVSSLTGVAAVVQAC